MEKDHPIVGCPALSVESLMNKNILDWGFYQSESSRLPPACALRFTQHKLRRLSEGRRPSFSQGRINRDPQI